jgi:hypothetical protein
LEILRKSILKTVSVNCFSPATPERALARHRARATPARRMHAARTRRRWRTHRSMRRTGVLLCVTSVSAWTVPSGYFPLAGVPTAARHWAAAPPHVAAHCCPQRACTGDVVDPKTPNRPPASINNRPRPVLARTRIRHRAPPFRHWRRPVQTSLPSTPSPPQAPELFLVHLKSSPSRLLIKPSRTIAGARAPAAAAGPPPTSSLLRRSSEPRHLPSIFLRSNGSFRCNTLLSIAPFFTAVRVPAAAPPLLRRRRSPATSPAEPPPPIAQSHSPAACLPPHASPRRRRAPRRRVQWGRGTEGMVVKGLKLPRGLVLKDSSQFYGLVQ